MSDARAPEALPTPLPAADPSRPEAGHEARPPSGADPPPTALEAALRQRDEAIGQLGSALLQRDEAIGQLGAALRQRDEQIGAFQAAVLQRDQTIGQLQAAQRQHDALFGQLNAALLQRDEAIGQLQAASRQKDEAIGQLQAASVQRDEALGQLADAWRQRDEAIGQLSAALVEGDQSRNSLSSFEKVLGERDEHIARLEHRQAVRERRHGAPDAMRNPRPASRDCMLIFQHLAKTAGVTLAEVLQANLLPHQYLSLEVRSDLASAIGSWSPADIVSALLRLTPPAIADLRAIWGHLPQRADQYLPKPAAYFTLLREPVDRVMSAFYYAMETPQLDPDGTPITLADYARRKRHYDLGLDNAMTRVLSGVAELDPSEPGATTENAPLVAEHHRKEAERRLDGYLLVGTTERFDETLVILASDLGWSLSDMVYRSRNVTAAREPRASLPREVEDKIRAWNIHDIALYERAGALLNGRIEGYGAAFESDLALLRELNRRHAEGASPAELRDLELRRVTERA